MKEKETRAIMDRPSPQILRLVRSPLAQLAAYFVFVGVVLVLAAYVSPGMRQFLLPVEPAYMPIDGFSQGAAPQPEAELGFWERAVNTGVVGVLSIIGALIFAIPVVRIYTLTMRQQGYEGSFVRLLVGLPLVVAGVVQVVRGDLALAFALAGIVAAVRFRTTVKDLQDAAFAFVAIGIGLASGTGSFVLAGAISSMFTLLAWSMWRLKVGDLEPALELAHGGVTLSEALVPGEETRSVVVGEREAVRPIAGDEVLDLSESIDRLSSFVRADAMRRSKKYGSLLLAYVTDIEAAESAIESVLDDHAQRWVQVERIDLNHGSGGRVLEYLVRLKKKVDVGTMFDEFECGPDEPIKAIELKSIRGFRKRIT
jgi:hypothetical protein